MAYQKKKNNKSLAQDGSSYEQQGFAVNQAMGSNSERIAMMQGQNQGGTSAVRLNSAFQLIANGLLVQAKERAHEVANLARESQDTDTVRTAGDIWTIAHRFQTIQDSLDHARFSRVKSEASSAATLTRAVMGRNILLKPIGDRLVISAGGYWEQGEQGIQQEQSTHSESSSNTTVDKPDAAGEVQTIPDQSNTSSFSTQLSSVYVLIAQGQLAQAKTRAHEIANAAREAQEPESAGIAGEIWTIATQFQEIQNGLQGEDYALVKSQASSAADKTRKLLSAQIIAPEVGERVLTAAGGYWTMAEKMIVQSRPSTAAPEGSAASAAQSAETVDQHRLNHPRRGAYCGVATLMMLFQANGKSGASQTQEMNQIASRIYIKDRGSDVDLMGRLMRERGFNSAQSTRTGGMEELLNTLDKGQPVPFGVMRTDGVIIKLNSNGSKNYPYAKVGDFHQRAFGRAGHWVLVTGYEGPRENPTHFILNDPDLGGQVRSTRQQLTRMGIREGRFYQITQ